MKSSSECNEFSLYSTYKGLLLFYLVYRPIVLVQHRAYINCGPMDRLGQTGPVTLSTAVFHFSFVVSRQAAELLPTLALISGVYLRYRTATATTSPKLTGVT